MSTTDQTCREQVPLLAHADPDMPQQWDLCRRERPCPVHDRVCQTHGAHGEPVCVRALSQTPCESCPDAPEPPAAPARPAQAGPAAAGPPPVDCDHLWRKLPDLRAWLTRAVRSRLDIGEQWRQEDPDRFAERVAIHLTAAIVPVLDQHALAQAHQEYHRLGAIPYAKRVREALADLDHVRAKGATTHHDACWDEHIACLAARIRRTLTGED